MVSSITSPHCILVTGANGFVGSHVIGALLKSGYTVKAVVHKTSDNVPSGVELIVVDISVPFNWSKALSGVTTIIHLAARVHQMDESPHIALKECRNINTRATLELAQEAAKAGIQRFIYLSTIAINGAFTEVGEFFTEESTVNPKGSYAISKYEAELGLQKLAKTCSMVVTIIRPPMIYGVKASGNFSRLITLVRSSMPLPFGLVKNPRSFIFIENLVSFILTCINHPDAGNELFLVSDDEDLSLSELILQLSSYLNVNAKLLPVPLGFLQIILIVIGKGGLANKLVKPMRINIAKARSLFGWSPPYSAVIGLNLSTKK